MKILHINEVGSLVGGAETYIFNVAKALSQKGNENVLIYGEEFSELECNFSGKKYRIPELTQRYKKFDTGPIKEIIKEENPDIVYFHQVFHPHLIEELASLLPTAAYVHGVALTCPGRRRFLERKHQACDHPLGIPCQIRAYSENCMPRNPITGLRCLWNTIKSKKAFSKLGRLIVPSEYLKKLFIENGLDEKKIEVIPYFTFLPEIKETKPTGTPQVLFVGRIIDNKGIFHFLKALRLLKLDHNAVVIGTGPDTEKAEEFCKKENIKVQFKGYMDHENMAHYYENSAVIVFPSIYPESFGIVGIEAGAFCKPVVAFNEGGVPEWLHDGKNGILVKPYDVEDMASKIELLLGDTDTAKKMGQVGRDMVRERFSPEVHLDRLLKVFNELKI